MRDAVADARDRRGRPSSTSPARPASAAGCSTTTSARRSGCSSRSSAATARTGSSMLDEPLARRRRRRRRPRRARLEPDGPDRERSRASSSSSSSCSPPGAATRRSAARSATCSGSPATTSPRRSRRRTPRASIALRFGAEATVSYLFAIADGLAVQALSDPDRDQTEVLEAGRATARQLLRGRADALPVRPCRDAGCRWLDAPGPDRLPYLRGLSGERVRPKR